MARFAPGAIPSPNIWNDPRGYEIENHAVDRARIIENAMRSVRPWAGATVVDIGCGTGFHLPRFAAEATTVLGVEPHAELAAAAHRRVRGLTNVQVRQGSAQSLPLPDASVDIAHARWAYFFGPGCEPGLRELARVIRPGGAAFVIDNDASRSTFGRWFARSHPRYDQRAVDSFFSQHGWQALRRTIEWTFETRADLETVVRLEFPPQEADLILAEHIDLTIDYAIVVRVWRPRTVGSVP